jgi:hypothetical protein
MDFESIVRCMQKRRHRVSRPGAEEAFLSSVVCAVFLQRNGMG